MRCLAALAAAGLLASRAEGIARPSSSQFFLASIMNESSGHDMDKSAPVDEAPEAKAPISGNPLWAIPVSKLSATRDRPLFSVSRRAIAPAAPAAPGQTQTIAAQPLPERPPFTLVGTIVGVDSRIAILYDKTSKVASGLHEGQRADGWTVRAVYPGSATLEGSGRVVTLELPRPEDKDLATPVGSAAPSKGNLTPDNSNGL